MDEHFIHGHRGARGIFPENTIVGFQQSFKQGVRAFELDLVVSEDKHLVVSHEPYMNALFCLDPTGRDILKKNEKNHNLYRMTLEEIQRYDVGTKCHPLFPRQKNSFMVKPSLSQLIRSFSAEYRSNIFWNIEIKSEKEIYGTYQPYPQEFAHLVLAEISSLGIESSCMIQSFDPNIIEAINQLHSNIPLSFLIENKLSLHENLERLTFVPQYYNPLHTLINQDLIDQIHALNMKIVPWTVNEYKRAQELIDMGVNGIISDYPADFLNIAPSSGVR